MLGARENQHAFELARECVALFDFARRVSAAGVGDPLIITKTIRSIHQQRHGIEFGRVLVLPRASHKGRIRGGNSGLGSGGGH